MGVSFPEIPEVRGSQFDENFRHFEFFAVFLRLRSANY